MTAKDKTFKVVQVAATQAVLSTCEKDSKYTSRCFTMGVIRGTNTADVRSGEKRRDESPFLSFVLVGMFGCSSGGFMCFICMVVYNSVKEVKGSVLFTFIITSGLKDITSLKTISDYKKKKILLCETHLSSSPSSSFL